MMRFNFHLLRHFDICERHSRPEITDPVICDQLRLIREQVGELSTDIRRIAYRLHPTILDDLGLAVALSSYVDDLRAREGINAVLELNDLPKKMRPATALAIYRIVQEAARNVVRHAPAAEATIKVGKVENRFELQIRDNGPGFDRLTQRTGGLGLTSMEERARAVGGTFEVRSTIGEGTEISFTIPNL